jgi:elongation factor Ts
MTITTAMIKELREATGAGPLDCKKALQDYDGNIEKASEYLRGKGLARAAKKASRETNDGLVIVKSSGNNTCVVEVNCETDFVARTDEFKILAHRVADQLLADASLTDADKLLATDFIDTPGKTIADVIQELISKLGENITIRRLARYTSNEPNIVEGYVHAGAIEGYYGPMEGRIGVLVELGVSDTISADNDALSHMAHDLALQIAAINSIYLSPDDIPDEVMQEKRESLMAQLASANKPDAIKAKIIEGRLNKFYQEVCLLNQAFIKDDSISIETLLQQKSKEIGTLVTINRFIRLEVGA